MAMTSLPRLQWLPTRALSVRALALWAICVVAGAGLFAVKLRLDAQLAQRERQLTRVTELAALRAPRPKPPAPALSPAAAHQLKQQLALLNRDWSRLSRRLAPHGHKVRLLGMDVDPTTGSIHVTGSADSTMVANTYAQSLSQQADVLRQVRLLQLEQDEDGIHFEISAQWID